MSWIITGTEKLPSDSDAAAYIANIEAADGQELEYDVRMAINAFVRGCKADGIWDAIKASCILAGARTLSGALTPLVGTAPTNFNFVAGDYNRETGLIGDGSTKYLDSNRNARLDPTDNAHLAVYATSMTATSSPQGLIGAGSISISKEILFSTGLQVAVYFNSSSVATGITGESTAGFKGASRASSTSFVVRSNGSNTSAVYGSSLPDNETTYVFARGGGMNRTNARLTFYSIGESLDLALLDARVTALINAIGAAIP